MSPQRQLQKGKCYKSLQQRSALFSVKEETHLEQIHRRRLRLNNQDVQELGALFHIVQSCWWETCAPLSFIFVIRPMYDQGLASRWQHHTAGLHFTHTHREKDYSNEGSHRNYVFEWGATFERFPVLFTYSGTLFLSVITIRLDHFHWLFGAGIKLNQNHSTTCNLCQSAGLLCLCYCHQMFQLPGCRQEKYAIPLWLWFTTLSAPNLSWPL